jgi:prolyl-tRNA synthetase
VTTRLVGALVMTHSDDQGLVLPPRLAPIHVVVVPIFKTPEEKAKVLEAAHRLAAGVRDLDLRAWLNYEPVSVKVDDRDQLKPGFKFNEWELKGVPVRVELGPNDLAKEACVLARRDLPGKEFKEVGVPLAGAAARIGELLRQMQTDLFNRARAFRDANMHEVDTYDEFKKKIDEPGGFFLAHWDGTRETEDKVAAETKATIRCIPFDRKKEAGKCMVTGRPSEGRVVFAKAY